MGRISSLISKPSVFIDDFSNPRRSVPEGQVHQYLQEMRWEN